MRPATRLDKRRLKAENPGRTHVVECSPRTVWVARSDQLEPDFPNGFLLYGATPALRDDTFRQFALSTLAR